MSTRRALLPMPARLTMLWLGLLCSAHAQAADIYRCQINGVTTFVDSPRQCPDGSAKPQGGNSARPSMPQVNTAPRSNQGMAIAGCERLARDPSAYRQCLHDQRSSDAREVANARLQSIGRAVTAYITRANRQNDILAVSKNGRSPAWCESMLSDVMAQKDLDVVDDERVGGPRWIKSDATLGRSAAPIMDDDFKEWRIMGDKVPDGYVTVRWRGSAPLVLRIVAACSEDDDHNAHCNPRRHVAIYVYDDVTPMACDLMALERPYWGNWQQSMTPIFTHGDLRMDRLREERKVRRTPRTQ